MLEKMNKLHTTLVYALKNIAQTQTKLLYKRNIKR